MKRTLALAVLLLPFSAQAFSLQWPLKCTIDKDCFVQNYVDRDAGPGTADYTCGWSTYENAHDGTDIRLKDLNAMRKGVDVLAAADGTVQVARDSVDDKLGHGEHSPNHQDCGNAVLILHDEGYETLYCHMKRGSIAVKAGQHVAPGDKLGQVGLSGFTDFPHLHFSVRKDKKVIDPFDGMPAAAACNSHTPSTLWQHPPTYHPTALLSDGFLDKEPEKDSLHDAPVPAESVKRDAPVLSYWVSLMGVRPGDVLAIRITAPDGSAFAEHSGSLNKASPDYFAFIGQKTHGKLTPGTYKASMVLSRNGAIVLNSKKEIVVN